MLRPSPSQEKTEIATQLANGYVLTQAISGVPKVGEKLGPKVENNDVAIGSHGIDDGARGLFRLVLLASNCGRRHPEGSFACWDR